jgi:hypothetical protein
MNKDIVSLRHDRIAFQVVVFVACTMYDFVLAQRICAAAGLEISMVSPSNSRATYKEVVGRIHPILQ